MSLLVTNQGAAVDLIIRRGATFYKPVTFTTGAPPSPVDITGRTYAAQIRRASDDVLVATFTCALVTPASGIMSFSLTAVQTAVLLLNVDYRWDMEETNGAAVNEIFSGRVGVTDEVTT